MKVAVLGAGICGLAAAKTLAKRGRQVILFEQFAMFHDRGSSHGESRIVRRAYVDPFYTACMAEAYPMWAELETDSGRKLIDECGLLYFGHRDSTTVRSVIDGLSMLKVPFEVRDHDRAGDLSPTLRLEPDEVAIWTPEAGWVAALAALRALYELAEDAGLEVRESTRADPRELAAEYDAVVVTAGSWTTKLAPIPVKVTVQTFAYVQESAPGPVWIEDGLDLMYGIPGDPNGHKIGVHRAGPEFDPDSSGREPSQEFLDVIRSTASRRFGITTPNLWGAKTCLYTTTSTEDFLLGRLAPNVFFASACSGHGFKLGLWIGRLLADFVDGLDTPERHPRFYWNGWDTAHE